MHNNKIYEFEDFNIYFDSKNKWTMIFTDKTGKIVYYNAIPPTTGNRIDLITTAPISKGYAFNLDVIIIIITAGEPEIIGNF